MIATMTLLALAFLGRPAQSPDMQHRSDMVMGFDQAKTAHHFRLYTDGGAIEVGVRDEADAGNRDAIQSHLAHIAKMFSEGDFDAPMLVHDSTNVPGTKVMTARKAAIRYRYEKTPDGGRVSIVTTDAEALAAVHEFLRYQIVEHKTGDPVVPQKR
jgi:hypothetical protein